MIDEQNTIEYWQQRAEQAESDYSMLRALARRMFAEDTNDQDALNLWNIAATVDHPGAALNIRWNRAKAVIAAARSVLEQGAIGGYTRMVLADAIAAFDARLEKESSSS
jgi:hypothetical protein